MTTALERILKGFVDSRSILGWWIRRALWLWLVGFQLTIAALLNAQEGSRPLRQASDSALELRRDTQDRPNILLIVADDMGYSDIGCYGGEVGTPNLDALAANGLRYTQFYNTAKCCPSRASLLTGLHPHQVDIGHMTFNDEIDAYRGDLSPNSVTIAEALGLAGYKSSMTGKWHVTRFVNTHKHNWPLQRGFDDFYGIITGAASYYQPRTLTRNNERIQPEGEYFITDVITEESIRQLHDHADSRPDQPFFQYVAYTAPHWPLHAHEEDIAKYKGRFDAGWDVLRKERLQRLVELGIIDRQWALSDRDPQIKSWEETENKDWEVRRMEVYAAMIDRMDQGIGRIFSAVKELGQWENTLILFLSDNGPDTEHLRDSYIGDRVRNGKSIFGTAKNRDGRHVRYGNTPDILSGPDDSYTSYGIRWANLSNTPFRLYKRWVHEGGIATPFIVHWPNGIKDRGELRHQPAQLPDVMATLLNVAGVDYPESYQGRIIPPLEGFSMLPTFENKPHQREVLYWEHEGNRAVRMGKWKLVSDYPGEWELYDMEEDRTELNNLAVKYPGVVKELNDLYFDWAERCGVMPLDQLLRLRKQRRERNATE
jgi:arylsulfatase A-like enzyme